MKISEITSKSDNELSLSLKDFKKESFNLRFQKTSGQLTNTSRVSQVRKAIAQIKTVINKRKLEVSGS
ncbi:50S ribosomal protein L29 [Candidatus Arcanobacter lacustris]|jgi:large subunit ribosomal protein L29|uniref:Large ribosomal subunit protein uL29 n=1 Tax=Candidatus Arcanibacter lacustris TaxID=1607817 RepID=A0A0F5MNQ8_9RICK|nr:50S ribosomal protein L29 [Candidatus Arcanobacter lacustris]